MHMREVNWFNSTEDSLGFFMTVVDENGTFICPRCERPCDYWEGQTGEEKFTGRPIIECQHLCDRCEIQTGLYPVGVSSHD